MKLPIYDLKDDGFNNTNAEGPEFTIYGAHTAERTADSLLSDIGSFVLTGSPVYGTEVNVADDWTLEIQVRSLDSGSFTVLSTSNIANGYGLRITVTHSTVVVYYVNAGAAIRWTLHYRVIPGITQSENFVLALIKSNDTLKMYNNGKLFGEKLLAPMYLTGTINLMGERERGARGKFYRVMLSPGVTLPENFLSRIPSVRDRALDNSYFIDEPILATDLQQAKMITDFQSFENSILVGNANGDVERFERPRGQDVGNSIVSTAVSTEQELIFTLDTNTEYNAGPVPELITEQIGTAITGTGNYVVAKVAEPLALDGNAVSYIAGRVSLIENGRQSPDYSTCAILESYNFPTTKVTGTRLTYVTSMSENSIGKMTEQGLKVGPGKYYVEGQVTLGCTYRSKFTIEDDSGEYLFSTGLLALGGSATFNTRAVDISTELVITNDTVLHLMEYGSLVWSPTQIESNKLYLRVYKVL